MEIAKDLVKVRMYVLLECFVDTVMLSTLKCMCYLST